MERLLRILLVVVIIAVPVNEIGRYATAAYNLDVVTRDTAQEAAREVRTKNASRDAAGRVAVQYAAERGVTLYGYDQTDTEVRVWTQIEVRGSVLVGPYRALVAGAPLDTSYLIQDESKAFTR